MFRTFFQRVADVTEVHFVVCTYLIFTFQFSIIFSSLRSLFDRYFERTAMSRKKGKKDLKKVVGQIENEEIAALQKKTSLTAAEIKEQHQVFKKMCPKGLVKPSFRLL